jgi:hypothetical protein
VVIGQFESRVGGSVTDNAARVGVGPGVRVGAGVGVSFALGVALNSTNGL